MVVTKQGAFKPRVITIPEWLFEDVCFQEEIRGVYYVDTPTLIYVHRSDHFFFTTQVASLDLSHEGWPWPGTRLLESSPLLGHGLIRIMRSKASGKGKGTGGADLGCAVALREV